jgi:DNA repair protein RadC
MTKEKPHYYGHRKRIREKFLKNGLSSFLPYEVIELLLTLAIPRSDVKKPAKELIKRFGSVKGVLDAPIEELQKVKGLGTVAPIVLHIIRETITLYLQQATEGQDVFAEPEFLERFWMARIGSLKNEVFQVGYLDSGYRLLRDGIETLEEGTVDRASVYPRKVIERALHKGASALVLAHNHPNGNVQPSEQDKLLTRAIVLAASTVQIKILDHLIVSQDKVFSFKKEGLL